ncbi:MAG TPA: alpha/beta hydrolase [Acidimicrobiales bacterium]|nr:alpha/beta hydrolase [Acidimicrobiales bacterium]
MRASAFRTATARDEYARIYRQAVEQSDVALDERDIDTSYGSTHVLTAGDPAKPPLVALHAKSFSSTMWIPLLPTLAASHHVHLVDAVGDLNLSVATRPLSKPAHVGAWLTETLDALSIERSAFVGASIGSWMAVHFTMQHPARVERLAMLCPAGVVSRQHLRWVMGMVTKVLIRPTKDGLEAFADSMVMPATQVRLRQDPWKPIVEQFAVGVPTFRSRANEARPKLCDITPLAALDIPMLTLVPKDETLHDGPAMAQRFRHKLPNARIDVVESTNHLMFIDDSMLVADRLRAFLTDDQSATQTEW